MEDGTSVTTFVLLNFEAEKLLKWFNDKTKWDPQQVPSIIDTLRDKRFVFQIKLKECNLKGRKSRLHFHEDLQSKGKLGSNFRNKS